MSRSSDSALIKAWRDLDIAMPRFPQRLGKSTRYDDLGEIMGITLDYVVMDELLQTRPALEPLAQFSNPAYPECDVRVEERKGDKKDPRNPNPAAGPRRYWVVIAGDRASAPINNSVKAEAKAKTLHEKLVAAAAQARQDTLPNWGRF